MEVLGSRRKLSLSSDDNTVPASPLYRPAPDLEARLLDFELYAVQRLRGKGIIIEGKHAAFRSDEINNKDIISHLLLHLVYCSEEELRNSFSPWRHCTFLQLISFQAPDVQVGLERFDKEYAYSICEKKGKDE